MIGNLSGQQKVDALNDEYREYVEKLKRSWLPNNQVKSSRVFEVMYPHEQTEVQEKLSAWERYIAPLAEKWWKQRGYGVVWPEDNSKSMQVYELKN